MNLGLMIPGTISGKVQMALGYRAFFVWVLLSSIPALLMARFVVRRPAAQASPSVPAAVA
jgi:PAT family beta-lactamase induction signal transducer AmpG